MSVRPKGWIDANLTEIAGNGGLITDGDWVESKDQDPNGQIRLLQLADIGEFRFIDKSSRFLNEPTFENLRCTELKENDVLIARMPDPLGRACVLPKVPYRAVTVVDVCIWRSGSNGADPNWVACMINSPVSRNWIYENSSGTTRVRISTGNLKKYTFPFPPLAEQKRIVEKLDSLTTSSREAAAALANVETLIERYRGGVLTSAFKAEELWGETLKMGDILTGIKAGKNLRCEERPPNDNERGVVKVSAVTYGYFDPLQSKTLPESFAPDPDTLIRADDFLFSRANTFELVGATALVKNDSNNLYLSDKILRLDMPDDLKIWIDSYLKSPLGRKQLSEASSGNQASMRNISQKNLRQVMIPMTSPDKRAEIIERIESAFAQIEALSLATTTARSRLEDLDRAMLDRAFKGKLVPQEPNDEPASVLLDRIQEEKAEAAKKPEKRTSVAKSHGPKAVKSEIRKTPKMTKSRFDDDVKAKPYLAQIMKRNGYSSTKAQFIFAESKLPISDFYKQLSEEIANGFILDRENKLEIGNAT